MSKVKTLSPHRLSVYLAVISTLVSTSFLDPVNWPKQVALITLLPLILFYSLRASGLEFRELTRTQIFIALSASIGLWLLSAIVNWQGLARTLFGFWGRNNGFLSLAAFALVALAVSISVRSLSDIGRFLVGVTYFATFSGFYAVLQIVGSDPIPWSKKGEIFAFFGNTNFASAIFGLGASCAFSLTYLNRRKKQNRFIFATLALFLTYITFSTNSLQGLVIIAFVSAFIIYFLLSGNSTLVSRIYLILVLLGGSIAALGTAGFGPLGSALYQYTINLRTWYWRVGLEMGSSNPIFGVGVDSYGDYYREFRPTELIRLTSMDLTVNNAHNTFIQIYATLGVIGLIGLIIPFSIAIPIAYREILNPSKNEKSVAVIIFLALWAAAAISIDNIAIAVWNWAFLGIILSFSFRNLDISLERAGSRNGNKVSNKRELYDWNLLAARAISIMFFLFAWQASSPDRAILEEKQNYVAPEDNSAKMVNKRNRLLAISTNPFLMEKHVADLAIDQNAIGGWSRGLDLVKSKAKTYPNDFYLWDQLAVFEENGGSVSQAINARRTQLTIDPNHAPVWLTFANDLIVAKRYPEALGALRNAYRLQEFLNDEGKQRMFAMEQQVKDGLGITN